ncbi:hypothetical protein J6590_077934 [Homalodisca vitripennis]|nr:hypothetical protein J6590_077934 [Homalodisca vitripennis]
MAVVLGRTGSLSGQPSKQQPRSTLLDSSNNGYVRSAVPLRGTMKQTVPLRYSLHRADRYVYVFLDIFTFDSITQLPRHYRPGQLARTVNVFVRDTLPSPVYTKARSTVNAKRSGDTVILF